MLLRCFKFHLLTPGSYLIFFRKLIAILYTGNGYNYILIFLLLSINHLIWEIFQKKQGLTFFRGTGSIPIQGKGIIKEVDKMEDKVIDPVCKMRIEKNEAKATADHKERTYYFCAEGCKSQFVESPEKYLEQKGGFGCCCG